MQIALLKTGVKISALGGLAALAACATGMSENECANADWYAVGQNDGLFGDTVDKFNQRAERCLEFGITADSAAWRNGYERGLDAYCTPQGGYDAGIAGSSYKGVCRGEREAAFLEEFNIGSRLYVLTTEYDEALADYQNAIADLDKHRREIRGARNRYEDPNLSNEDREIARQDREHHRREIERLEYDLPKLERDVEAAAGRLDDYRAFVDRRSR